MRIQLPKSLPRPLSDGYGGRRGNGRGHGEEVTRDAQRHTRILPVPFVPSHAHRNRPRHARHVQSRRAAQSRAARATVTFTLSFRIPLQLNGFVDRLFCIYDTRGRVHYMLPTGQARGPPRQDAILLRPPGATMRSLQCRHGVKLREIEVSGGEKTQSPRSKTRTFEVA